MDDAAIQDPHPPVPPPGAAATEAPDRMQRRAQAATDALRALVRDHALRRLGSREPADGSALDVTLRFGVRPADGWSLTFDPPLAEQVEEQLDNSLDSGDRFQRGRIHCFRCATSDCPHASPPNPLSVFRGYSSTGVPEWCEMAQVLIEAQDERVDLLFASPPSVLARVQMGRELRSRQLAPFGRASRSYALLGQVVAGYLTAPVGAGPHRRADRLALTIQVVETRDQRGKPRLTLNPVTVMSPPEWEEWLVSSDVTAAALAAAISQAGRELDEIGIKVAHARDENRAAGLRQALQGVPGVLNGLARALERGNRQTRRRTLHAQLHPRQERPVHKALDDARAAVVGNVFFDEKHQTWVVCGRQGRTHAFNAQGRHVTSFTVPSGAPEFRVRTQRWRPADADEVTAFLQRFVAEPPGGKET